MRVAGKDGEFALLRFGREGAPPLLFAHANGFCASAYRQMLEQIGARRDVFAVDLRGHGRTTLPTQGAQARRFDLHGADVSGLLTTLGAHVGRGLKWTLSGHSLGAVAATLAAVGRDDVAAIRLVEPVAPPPIWRTLARSPFWPMVAERVPIVAGARRRRRMWSSRADVLASYAGKPFFAGWARGVLEDYLADGLKKEGGGVALSCAPDWEAGNFAARPADFFGAIAKAPAPVAVLAARHPSSTTPAASIRRLQRLGAVVDMIEGVSHLAPFEAPAAAAGFLAPE